MLRSELNFQATSFALWDDGFVTGAQALARVTVSDGQLSGYHVPIFNRASNQTQRSTLRLVNTSDRLRHVTVRGFDDRGAPAPGGEVRVSLEAGESRTITAGQLEAGATNLVGSLGTGNGRWRLLVSAEPDVLAMSLLRSRAGHSANVSRDQFVKYWAHVTGGRSRITTETRFDSSVGFGTVPPDSGSSPP